MRIELKKFGDMLISRPAGREAYLALSAYITKDVEKNEEVAIDFSDVKVMTPSWADEVITKIFQEFPNVHLEHTENPTVQATLKTLREYSGVRI